MDERTKHLQDALARAIDRFLADRDDAQERASEREEERPPRDPLAVHEVDERVLQDLASKYNTVLCPIHGSPPRFDLEGTAVREWFCCETLLSLVRELSRKDAAA